MTIEQGVKVGQVFKINNGESIRVEQYIDCYNVYISFLGNYTNLKRVSVGQITSGNIKNNYKRSVVGVGYLGDGCYKSAENGKKTECYLCWVSLITRCYKSSANSEHYFNICTVHEDWHNFQNFAGWYYKQRGCNKGYPLDKDLITKGNKHYSPETCCLVPREVNNVIIVSNKNRQLPAGVTIIKSGRYQARISIENKTVRLGVYDTAKDAHEAYVRKKEASVRGMAEKWKNEICDNAYNALRSWSYYE